MKFSEINNLKFKNPEIARQWHPGKNGDLAPENVTPNSKKKVWWKCDKGHEWMAVVSSRNRGNGCPYCKGKMASKDYNLQVINPLVAKQWHPTKNGSLKPKDFTPYSGKKVWWICEKGHEWQAVIACRSSKGSGCPYCSGNLVSKENNLKIINPMLAKQWHPTKNGDLKPEHFTPGSDRKVWWQCKKGHQWQAHIFSRNKGIGCPFCKGKKASDTYNLERINPELAKEWHPLKNGTLKPRDVTPSSDKKVWWKCKQGHEWKASIGRRNQGTGCPICFVPKPNEGSFKKGRIPGNFKGFYKPRSRINNTYAVITIEETQKFKAKKGKLYDTRKIIGYARYLYGLHRIPEGWVIWHLDGDPLNNNMENLECISREEALRRMRERKTMIVFG
jgi:starvation-inducible outer membrane lipoprotein